MNGRIDSNGVYWYASALNYGAVFYCLPQRGTAGERLK